MSGAHYRYGTVPGLVDRAALDALAASGRSYTKSGTPSSAMIPGERIAYRVADGKREVVAVVREELAGDQAALAAVAKSFEKSGSTRWRYVKTTDIVGVSEIAERLGTGRNYVTKLARGEKARKRHPFPKPLKRVGGMYLYDWSEVAHWWRHFGPGKVKRGHVPGTPSRKRKRWSKLHDAPDSARLYDLDAAPTSDSAGRASAMSIRPHQNG